jgi:hypothetical protein
MPLHHAKPAKSDVLTRPKLGDIVYVLKRNDHKDSRSLVILRGWVTSEDDNGILTYKWDGADFEKDDYIHPNRVYTSIRALFKNDPEAKSFAYPDFENKHAA